MTQPSVTITELDGTLGVLPPSGVAIFALVGVSSAGTANAPATYSRVKDIVAQFGRGPLVEAACYYVERYGNPVLLVKTAATTVGSFDAIDVTGVTGTSVATLDTPLPDDDYEIQVSIVNGGTRGTTGITYRVSYDGGRTFGSLLALGTATAITIANSGGVNILLAAGTLATGDVIKVRCHAPTWNSSDIGTALTALGASTVSWELVHVVGPVDATLAAAIDLKIAGFATGLAKFRAWIGNTRIPNAAESEATYLSTLSAAFASFSTVYGSIYAGACKMISSVSGRNYRRPAAFIAAAREASVSQEIDIASINLGALNCTIRDVNGNPDEHDETANPGLDDARFAVLRTWVGFPGVYVNRPRLMSAEGSDFQLMPHRRVLNIAHSGLRNYFIKRLNKPIQVNATTGYILEEEALEIEAGALAVMRASLLAKPKASGVQFTLSRTDNLLSTKTLTGQARVIPLGYPEFINLDLGFLNPALQVQKT